MTLKTYTAADLAAMDLTHDDRDYRRGYVHGYSQAMDDLQAEMMENKPGKATRAAFDAAWQRCAEFFDDALHVWRMGDCKRMTPPPVIGASDEQ